ncbi:MAG TPA: hypothetical protein VMS71_07365 [Candidatus Acidoferrum sp.]|nr:hypothetical protein [Candidatus Acidoferrum sp.]
MGMIYTFHHKTADLKFTKNRGKAIVTATEPYEAIRKTRELFGSVRDIVAKSRGGGLYTVSFRVSLDYRLALVRSVQRAVRILRNPETYSRARYIDRYILATLCSETGKPEWLAGSNLKEEISALRKGAVVAREVNNVMRFVDWDIVIYNYLELNSKVGHHSRVVRAPAL